jgi:hypothetical protein
MADANVFSRIVEGSMYECEKSRITGDEHRIERSRQ